MDNRHLGNPGTPAFRVDKYPFYLLNRLVSRYNAVIEFRLRAIGLDIPSWRVLMVLGQTDALGVREIADKAVIPLSTMTRIVRRMETASLVRLSESEEDGRVTRVSLCPLGEAKLAEARAITAPIYGKITRGLSAAQFEKLISLLNLLYNNLEEES